MQELATQNMDMRVFISQLAPPLLRSLCVDWFEVLASENGINFTSSEEAPDRISIKAADGFEVVVEISESSLCRFTGNDPARKELIDALANNAVRLALEGATRGFVWHHIPMTSNSTVGGPRPLAGLLQMLSSQRRINRWTRLSDSLLEFAEETCAEERQMLAPKTTVNVYLRVPGPKVGRFSRHFANNGVELFSAICSFALGRPVDHPNFALDAAAEQWPDLEARYRDPSVPFLARNGVALNFISTAPLPGSREYIDRLETALITFEAALSERNDGVACILYVVAAESLCVPNADAKWRKEKATDRFITFYEELMRDELDKIVAHGNFEEIFSIKRGKKGKEKLRYLLLDAIYTFRSGLVHGGLRSTPRTHLPPFFQGGEDLRRSLFMDFAEAAILRYLQEPHCSTVGSPIDQKPADSSSQGAAIKKP